LVLGGAIYAGYSVHRHDQFRRHFEEAKRAADDGRTSAAISHIAFCTPVDPEDRELMLLTARVLRMLQAWPQAEEVLDRYWTLNGDDEGLTFERLLLKAAGDTTAPVAPLLAARIAFGGENAKLARHALVSGYLREFRYTDAFALLEVWRTEQPADPMADYLLGSLEEQRFNMQRARELFSELVARQPDHSEARLRLVVLLMMTRDANEALGHLAVLRSELPNNAEVAVQWFMALRQVGRTEEAVRALDAVLALHPNSAQALTERATLALNAGDDQAAADFLTHALRSDPGSVNTRNLYIQALSRLDRTDQAAEEQVRVTALLADNQRMTELVNGPLQTRPDDPSPAYEIAGIALRSGQPGAAINWYQLALKRAPNHTPSHTALAVIYREMGNPVLATRHRALAASAGQRP
jgi:tetratricopeptide (TPR) repeat protein